MWKNKDEIYVIKSPIEGDLSEIPLAPLAEYVLTPVEENLEKWGSRPWMVNTSLT
jgi:hypothetical protein